MHYGTECLFLKALAFLAEHLEAFEQSPTALPIAILHAMPCLYLACTLALNGLQLEGLQLRQPYTQKRVFFLGKFWQLLWQLTCKRFP